MSEPPGPRVSVVVPVYNMRRFLGEAIESILDQSLAPSELEIIVVDDGSSDGSGAVAAGYGPRIRVIRQDNRGLPAARNAGIRAARAPLLQFLDADDRLLPTKLAAGLGVLEDRPEVGLAYSGWYYVSDTGTRLPHPGWTRLEGDVMPELLLGNLVHPHCPVVRRQLVEQVGGFDESLTSVEDWDLWLRLSRRGARWACIDQPLVEYRLRADGMHQDAERMLINRLRVLAKLFADPLLPAHLAGLRATAHRNAYLVAACDHYRAGDVARGAAAFRAAVAECPTLLADPAVLRQVCRWLLPLGWQRDALVAEDWRRLSRLLRTMLDHVFEPPVDPQVGRMRWRARAAYWRTIGRLARKERLGAMRWLTHRRASSAMTSADQTRS